MLKNFLLVAFRNMRRSRMYSIINILGLAIGLATSLFITIYIIDELSYDKHFANWENIYRVQMRALLNGTEMEINTIGSPAALAIKKEIPGVISTTRFINRGMIVKVGDNVYSESRIYYADSTFYNIFSYKIIDGDKVELLNKPNTVVLTQSTSKKYFGDKNPVGEIIKIDGVDYKVTGLVEDCKRASHFHYDLLASMVSLESSWYNYWMENDIFNIYVLLDPKANIDEVNSTLQAMAIKKIEPEMVRSFGITLEELFKKGNWVKYFLFPVQDIHLKSHTKFEIEPNSNEIYIYIFLVIAIFILIIACVNYMNLSTARSATRAKETAIRKVVGAKRSGLIGQFLSESIIQSFLALLFALILIETILPLFNRIASKDLSIGYTENIMVIPCLILIAIAIGIVSGIYSAIHLSSVNTLVMLKSKLLTGNQHKWFRNILVVFQFTISIFIIITTLIIYSQLQYIQNKDIGYDKKNMLVLRNINLIKSDLDVLKHRLNGISGIKRVSATSNIMGNSFNGFPGKSEDDLKTARVTRSLFADNNIVDALGLKVLEGRFFSNDFPNDTFSIVINEATAKEYNYKNPIGKHIVTQYNGSTIKWKIIGVIKDFNFYSLHEKIGGLVIQHHSQGRAKYMTIRYESERVDMVLSQVKSIWSELYPDIPFEYYFFEDSYNNQYKEEYRTSSLFVTFSILAIIVSCLGLFGLASFIAERKTREIAIRKVVGANETTVVLMLLKQFTSWVIIANIFAYPIAWIFAKKWMQNFAYHIDISIWYFVLATTIVLLIALFTVASQALMAARTNPAEKLKNE